MRQAAYCTVEETNMETAEKEQFFREETESGVEKYCEIKDVPRLVRHLAEIVALQEQIDIEKSRRPIASKAM